MKFRTAIFALVALAAIGLAACQGCSSTGSLHGPSTVGNVPIVGNVGYGAAGIAARQVLAMDICATPPIYPCVSQSVKDRVIQADTAAYDAAVIARAAGATAQQKADANAKANALKNITDEPDIKKQTDIAAEKAAAKN